MAWKENKKEFDMFKTVDICYMYDLSNEKYDNFNVTNVR